MKKRTLRPLGEILLDMEPLIDEMCIGHSLQFGDILTLVHSHLRIHNPDSQEKYLDGASPMFFYGPKGDE